MDLLETVIDEIALEGLPGITLPSLWVRLSPYKSFDFQSAQVQQFVWSNIVVPAALTNRLAFYKLPAARSPLLLYDRNAHINTSNGTLIEDPLKIPEDIYGEVVPVSDKEVFGSCPDYKKRVEVTQDVIQSSLSVAKVIEVYGAEKFAIVASQEERKKCLLGTSVDPFLELTPLHYCILERIGRQRWAGDSTLGKEAGKYKTTAKTLFYYRKKLFKHNLIKRKSCVTYNIRKQQISHGNIIYLSRFYVEKLSPSEITARRISNFLCDQPDNECDYDEIKEVVGCRTKNIRAVLQSYRNNFAFVERKEEIDGKVRTKKVVKMIKLLKDDLNETGTEDKDDDDEDEEEGGGKKFTKLFDPNKIIVNRPLLSQALEIVESCQSPEGISIVEVGETLSLPKLETRQLLRNLERTGDVSSVMVDRGRQKVALYIPRCKIDDKRHLFNSERKVLNVEANETLGFLRRANIILDYIKKVEIVDKMYALKKLIQDSEAGQSHKVDTKSIVRIVAKLASEGHINSFRTISKLNDVTRKLHIICIPSITQDSPVVKERIEQWKLKLQALSVKTPDDLINEMKRKSETPKRKTKKRRKIEKTSTRKSRTKVKITEINEAENKTDKKRRFDTIDLRARKLLKKQRTDWTPEEDAFLIVCKIASTLLSPNCCTYLCVNKNVIRDELHKYYPNVSKDKTAVACLRRINYMFKRIPETRQSVNDWVGELSQDERRVVNPPNLPKTREEEWKQAFVETLNYILTKIQSPNNRVEMIKINSIEELFERFTIKSSLSYVLPLKTPLSEDVRNVVDIHVYIVTNVLLSTLLSQSAEEALPASTSSKDNSQLLFKIYQRYPDSLIRSVVAKMNKCGNISKIKKNSNPVALKSRGTTPYKISKSYLFSLQTKYSIENLVVNIDCDEVISIENGKTGTAAALITSLFASRSASFQTEIPENIVVLDDRCPLASSVRQNIANPNDPKCSSRYALHIVRQELQMQPFDRIQHAQDYLVVNQCKILCNSVSDYRFPRERFQEAFQDQSKLISDLSSNISNPLIDFIKSKHELGASCDEIISFSNNVWPDEINQLQEQNLVFRVGTTNFKWIHADYKNPWLVNSYVETDKGEIPVNFFARFWKKPDSSVDKKVFFKYLSGILAHIMLFPCISQTKLIEHFSRILPATQILEIIELLVAGDCIEIILLEEIQKPKLFDNHSQPTAYFVSHYETTINSFVNLCKIKKLLNV